MSGGQQWMLPFLPYGAELLYAETQPKKAYLQFVNLDQDEFMEVIGIYRLNQELYLFVLNNFHSHWHIISLIKGKGYQVSYLGTANITSRNAKNLVVGWQVGAVLSKLSIYEWQHNSLKELDLKGNYTFSKIEIEDMPGQNGKDGLGEIALWSHDTGEAYRVEVYRWESDRLVPAKDVEPYYFQKVVKYYQQKIKEHPDYLFYYPYLEEAEKKTAQRSFDFKESRAIALFPASIKEIGGSKWGYINSKGKSLLPPIYDQAEDFQENGLAIVRLTDQAGIIDTNGHFIVQPKYDYITSFSEGRAIANDLQGFKIIDERGKEITPMAHYTISEFKEGRARFADSNQQGEYLYGYLNRKGKETIPASYEDASDFSEGKAIVKIKNGSYALIDLTGKVLHSYMYAFVGNYGEGLLAFKKSEDGKFGYMDELGNVVIKPQFSGVEAFSQGRAIVNVSNDYSNHYGVINQKGQFLMKPDHYQIFYLGEERYQIGKAIDPEQPYLGAKYAIADLEGHLITGFIYSDITKYKDGIASVSNDQSTFFIDRNGNRAYYLPMVSGSGTLEKDKTLIKGEIDYRLLYFNKKGELVWKQNTVIPLNKQYAVTEHKYKPNKDYLVYFPQIQGGAFEHVNQTLKDLSGIKEVPANTQLNSSYIGDFEVSFFKKNLLVIEINGYDYPFGAAHGMSIKKYAHVNLKTGLFYQLKDLFKPNAAYVKIISDRIRNQIKNNENYSYLNINEYKDIQPNQSFFISEGGLNIYYAQYEIASYAAGMPTFTILFEELSRIINRNGDFWKSFH
ncbi:WG repeat-containing protein [Neobacillus cucumis]|uniref:WG repeat-containing protein n=1 Tax=Neobacillus cucumis TaxID=1740721 RepID=UPI0018DFC692|nr:WG repeat-containing protein [Neobacillus cucumis]MBI0578881.1 WG repeat-containing protein [Neobacillus cucumis]